MANETWASAGRLLQLIKGPYDATTEYHLLDIVFYIGSTYICKGDSLGNLPTDTTYFQLLAQGATDATASAYFGTCDTQGDNPTKSVTVIAADNFVLKRGCIVGVNFTYTNTYVATLSTPITLNVNGTGVYNISFNGSATPTGSNKVAFGEANYTHYYMYDGYYWIFIGRSGVQTAEQTPFDNSTNGFTATDTQGAIEELDENKQDKTLATPITIAGENKTTVEGALDGLNDFAEDNISAIVNVYGSKNLLKIDDTSGAQSGITYTIQDGVITLNNTSTSLFSITLATNVSLKAGSYIISVGGNLSSYCSLEIINDSPSLDVYTDNSSPFTINSDISSATIRLWIPSNVTYDNIKVYPMIRDARIVDPTYVPYAKTNRELTEFLKEGSAYIDLAAISQSVLNGYISFYKIGVIKYLVITFYINDITNQPIYKPQSSTEVTNIPSGFDPIVGPIAEGVIQSNNDLGVALNPASLELVNGKIRLRIPALTNTTLNTYFAASMAYI